MKTNVGGIDRTLRIIGGLVLLALGIFLAKPVVWTVVFLVLGAMLLLTGLFRFCWAYLPFGINTRSDKTSPQEKKPG